MRDFWGDIRVGARLFARAPVFGLTATLLLGCGIGANTAIFTLVDRLLLRPLPVPDAARLVRLIEVHPTGFITYDLPYPLYRHLESHASALKDVLAQGDLDVAFEDGGSIERIRINAVSGNYFATLAMQPRLGRLLTAGDERSGAMVAVLSYDFWQRRYAGSKTVVGQGLRLGGQSFTIVGVLPEGESGLTVDTAPELRIPLSTAKLFVRDPGEDAEARVSVQIFGRLQSGRALTGTEAELEPSLIPVFEEAELRAWPELARTQRRGAFDSRLRLEPVGRGVSSLRQQFSRGLLLLMACVGLLLLMACSNVAGLLLARSAARWQEFAIRMSLGATPRRICRQLLAESLVLAVPGGVLGVALAYLAMPLLAAALPPIRDRAAVLQPLALHLQVDARALLFAVTVSVLAALLAGISPAIRAGRESLAGAMRGSRTTTARLGGRDVFVAVQVAMCVLLVAGASLLSATFHRMWTMDAGFDRDHLVTFTLDPGLGGYAGDRAKRLSLHLLERTRTLPGVRAAGIASRGLMRGTGIKMTVGTAGSRIDRSDFLNTSLNEVTPGYFDTLGMRLVAGRDFAWNENDKRKPQPVIVNQAFARRFYPGGGAVGGRFGTRGADGLAAADDEVIGVVSDAHYRSLREPIPPIVYTPAADGFEYGFVLHLRVAGDPAALMEPVRKVLASLAPGLPFIEARTMRQEVEASLWQERMLASLSTVFASFAALLAGIGLYGALDFAVKARTREIGVRAALGASPVDVVRILSKQVLVLVVGGSVAGLAGLLLAARWTRQVLYGVGASDAAVLAPVLLFVGSIAVLAAAGPVVRAVRIDPATALRVE